MGEVEVEEERLLIASWTSWEGRGGGKAGRNRQLVVEERGWGGMVVL